jgi:hypothetical protein
MKCTCDNGKITVTVMLYTDKGLIPQKPIIMSCIWCEGTGNLTEIQIETKNHYDNAWCNCNNPSKQSDYYKHEHSYGYTCSNCGKIL